jgi:hypothetical protein
VPKGDGERSLPDGGRRIPDEIKEASDTSDWGLVCNNVRFVRTNVRFGSKADMCSAQADVRLVPIADIA